MKTYKEFLEEAKLSSSQTKKAEKSLDKIMNSSDGGKLSNAWNDGAEDKAEKILTKNKLKGKDLDAVMAIMFGEI